MPPITPISGSPDAAETIRNRAQLGKDEFLQLLVTQLRNQDPMNPSDPNQMAAQLAQFSTVEQLVNIGEQLEAQSAANEALIESVNASSAMQLIGRTVLAQGDVVTVPAEGELSATIDVAGEGGSGELVMYDDAGNEVGRVPVPFVAGGRQKIDLTDLVGSVEPGRYTYQVELTAADGAPVAVQMYSTLRVDGLKLTQNGPVLTSGPVQIPLGAVIEIGE
jgi:flagellar basal-body rod modification protein FlgD